VSLARGLELAIGSMWPRRAQRELLLDLGERKRWTPADASAAVQRLAAWLIEHLGLPSELEAVPAEVTPDVKARLAEVVGQIGFEASTGVARWVEALAPTVGSGAKTLANSVSNRGLSSNRGDHRWLRLIARVSSGECPVDAWCYHSRTAGNVAHELAARLFRSDLDAADANLVVSLVSLWQRRRATSEVRANRGRTVTRRATPMPIAEVGFRMITPRQVEELAKLARKLPRDGGRSLALAAIEAALTTAHLAPHPARKSAKTPKDAGEALLRSVERVIDTCEVPLGADGPVLRFRVDNLRAYRDRRPQAPVTDTMRDSPYVRACLAIEAHRRSGVPIPTLDLSAPGLLMLLPTLALRAAPSELG